jgi:hypothetical protein
MFFLNIETELRSSNDMQFFIKLLPENFSSVCVYIYIYIIWECKRGTYLYSDNSTPNIEPSRVLSPYANTVIIIEN